MASLSMWSIWAVVGLHRRIVLDPVSEQAQMELRRRQDLLQVVVQDLRQAPALAVLRFRQLQRQLLELPGPVLQLRRALGHLALQRRVQLAQGLLRPLALGDIPGDLGEAVELPIFVPQRGNDHVRPEPLAALAYTLALFFIAALGGGPLQGLFRPSALPVLRRVEQGEMPSEDLRSGPALEPLGPGVPTGDSALRIEHEDRVVLHPFDQQAKPLLALTQCLLGPLFLSPLGRFPKRSTNHRTEPAQPLLEDVIGGPGLQGLDGDLPRRWPRTR